MAFIYFTQARRGRGRRYHHRQHADTTIRQLCHILGKIESYHWIGASSASTAVFRTD